MGLVWMDLRVYQHVPLADGPIAIKQCGGRSRNR